jgi:DNA-binding MarR family transcriptional regulator
MTAPMSAKITRKTPAVEEPLPPDLEFKAMPGHLIRRLHQVAQAVFDVAFATARIDLTPVQYAALATIAARPGLDQATLASEIVFDRATTGGVIDRLEAKGLVRREVAPGDRRARRLFAEAKGVALLAEVRPIVARVQTTMLDGLNDAERQTLLKLVSKALANSGPPTRTRRRTAPSAS